MLGKGPSGAEKHASLAPGAPRTNVCPQLPGTLNPLGHGGLQPLQVPAWPRNQLPVPAEPSSLLTQSLRQQPLGGPRLLPQLAGDDSPTQARGASDLSLWGRE